MRVSPKVYEGLDVAGASRVAEKLNFSSVDRLLLSIIDWSIGSDFAAK
jgi:hypothetical protein